MNTVFILFSIAFATGRFAGLKSDVVKDFDHVYIGMLLMGWIIIKGYRWLFGSLFMSLLVVECLCAFLIYPMSKPKQVEQPAPVAPCCAPSELEKMKVGAVKSGDFLGRGKLFQNEDPSQISFNVWPTPGESTVAYYLIFKARPDLLKVAQGFINKTAIVSGTITTLGKITMVDVTDIHQQHRCYCSNTPNLCHCDACECPECPRAKK